jgi:hypothetical protein
MLLLQPLRPIAGTALGMGNGNDLDIVKAFSVDDRKRIALENHATSPVQVERTN